MTKNAVLPQIRIKNAWLLRNAASVHLHKLWGEGEELVSIEWIDKKVDIYRKAWLPYETKVLNGICNTLGLSFRQNIIDVYIAPWFMAFSDPMVIGVIYEPKDFVDVLTHELLHRLLTDNSVIDRMHFAYDKEWQRLFGKKHSFKALVHIPVHAVHKAIYLDVLDEPERFIHDVVMVHTHNSTAYIEAWDYVEKYGYEHIIEQLKESYKKLAAKKP